MNEDTKQQEQKGNGVLPSVTNRTFKCLGCKHYGIVINDKGGTAKTCSVLKNDIRVIVDLDAPTCTDYVYGW